MMVHTHRLIAVVVLLLIGHSAQIPAQVPGRGGGWRPSIDRVIALSLEEVRDELQITEDQGATIRAAIEVYQEERRAARPDRNAFQFLSDEEQQELREELRQAAEEATRNGNETLAALLEPDQLKRLDQLIVQAKLRFTPIETLRQQIELSDEQLSKLQTVEEQVSERRMEMRRQMRERFQGRDRRNVDMAEVRKTLAKFQNETAAAAMAVLTDEQRASMDELKGEEFELDLQSLMTGPARRGRAGRPDGPGRRQRDGERRGGRGRRPELDDES